MHNYINIHSNKLKLTTKRTILFAITLILTTTSLTTLLPNTAKAEVPPNYVYDDSFNVGSGFNGSLGILSKWQFDSNGKLIVFGSFTTFNDQLAPYIIRLNPDGTRDNSFSHGGSGFNAEVYSVDIQTDGKVIVGGIFTTFNGQSAPRIIRLNTDGTRDDSFNHGGSGIGSVAVFDVKVQPDNKILISGSFTTFNGQPAPRMMRLNPDGTRDADFNLEGTGFDGTVQRFTLQSDGEILAAGNYTTLNGLSAQKPLRLNPDGSKDNIFNNGGNGLINGTATSILVQTDGKVITGSNGDPTYNGQPVSNVFRLNADGSLDESFSVGVNIKGTIRYIDMQPNGKLLVGAAFTGFPTVNGQQYPKLIRLNSDGSLDTTFAIQDGFESNAQVTKFITQPDGKIIVGGIFTTFNGQPAGNI